MMTDTAMPQPADMKTCRDCKRILEKSKFHKQTAAKDGLRGDCKECGAKRKKRNIAKNKEAYAATSRKHYQKNRDRIRDYSKEYGKKNKEKMKEKAERRRQTFDAVRYIADYKEKFDCIQCGFTHPAALEFHHRDPGKKKFLLCGKGLEKEMVDVIKEMSKCDLLCANCHRILHHNLRQEMTSNKKAS